MSTFVILKIIHIFGLMLGVAGGLGSGVVASKIMAGDGPPPPVAVSSLQTLGFIGRTGVITLWITGPLMLMTTMGTLALGWTFYVKLVLAVILLVGVLSIWWIGQRAVAAGKPPNLKLMSKIGAVSGISAFLAVVFAVWTFG